MKISNRVLFDIAQAVDFDRLAPWEHSVEIPAVVLPTAEVPQRLPPVGTFVTTDTQRTSFFTGVVNQLAAAQAAQSPLLATVGRGLWNFKIFASFYNSATEVPTLGARIQILLQGPGGTQLPIMGVGSVANQILTQVLPLRMLLAEDGWQFFGFLQATDAGEERQLFTNIWGEKLL